MDLKLDEADWRLKLCRARSRPNLSPPESVQRPKRERYCGRSHSALGTHHFCHEVVILGASGPAAQQPHIQVPIPYTVRVTPCILPWK